MRLLKWILLVSVVGLGSANAADLAPQPAEPMAPVYLPYSWTGFYVGVQAGGAWNDSHWSPAGGGFPPFNTDGSGAVFGAQIGYNYQINQFVLGIEGDFAGSTVKGDAPCAGGPITCTTKQDWLGSVRARAGYAFDRFLVYGDGGVAFSNYKVDDNAGVSFGDGTRTGWTAGVGVEYAFADHWTAGVEWNYYDFGSKTSLGVKTRETENVFVAKLNYKF